MNQYARKSERYMLSYKIIYDRLAEIYKSHGRIPESEETFPQGLYHGVSKIQWSREWEYAWAITESRVVVGLNVVDMGCGASPLPILLAENGCQVIGIDNSTYDEYKVHNEKRLWGHHKLSNLVDYRNENLTKTTIEDEWAHIVYCIGVIEHLKPEEIEDMKKEFRRVLVPGGYLVITEDFETGRKITTKDLTWEGFKLVGNTSFDRTDILNMGCDVFGWIQKKESK